MNADKTLTIKQVGTVSLLISNLDKLTLRLKKGIPLDGDLIIDLAKKCQLCLK